MMTIMLFQEIIVESSNFYSGGGVEPIPEKTAATENILASDGRPFNCVKNCREKDKTSATRGNIEKGVVKSKEMLV